MHKAMSESLASFQKKGVARTPASSNDPVEVHPSLSVIPPIERLPVELLAEIFILCISHSDYPPLIKESADPPISLCCVCKSWQKVAIGLPRLWTAVSVGIENTSLEESEKLPQLLNRWFSRSNKLPLSLKLASGNIPFDRVMETFIACVTPFANRFCHFDVDVVDFVCDVRLSASQPTQTQNTYPDGSWSTLQFPQLESVIIRNIIDVYRGFEIPLFPVAPHLQRLRMDRLSFIEGTPLQLTLPWSQLTHLILVNVLESHLWLQLFPMCPNLQHGLFEVFEDFTSTPSIPKRSIFHHLIDLTFGFGDPINPSILDHFDFPALKTLRLQNNYPDGSYGGDDMFWTANTRSRLCQQVAPLERLSLGGNWPFVCVFEAAAHVVELDLDDVGVFEDTGVPEAVLSSLLRRSDGYFPLPDLRVLSTNICNYSESHADVLADIIKSRHVERGIEKLTLYPWRDSESEKYMKRLTEQLQPLITDGFILELGHAMPSHWYERLDPSSTAWREGIIDIK